MAMLVLLATGCVGVVVILIAMYCPHALFPIAVASGLPVVMYGVISLLELVILSTKRGWTQTHQQRQRRVPRGVMHMSRALYEQLDRDMLQLLMSNRDFDSNDYERLMRLETLNECRNKGAAPPQIQRLPLITVTQVAFLPSSIELAQAMSKSSTQLTFVASVSCTFFRQ